MQSIYASLEFETAAHALVGRLLFVYSRLEVNIALCLAAVGPSEARNQRLQKLETASFAEKLQGIADHLYLQNEPTFANYARWELWILSANTLREQRNRLVHGRWGISEGQGFVANVVGLPGSFTEREARSTLPELEAEVEEAEAVSAEFWTLSQSW